MAARVPSPDRRSFARQRPNASILRNFRRATNNNNNGPWGDHWKHKPDDTIRLAFNNVGGVPVDFDGEKHGHIIEAMKEMKMDVFGIQEHNLNLEKSTGRETWQGRFRQWQQVFTKAAWNIHSTTNDRTLYGGTAIFVGKEHNNRVCEPQSDDRGLGRWQSVILTGKHGMKLRVVTAYRPVADSSNRPNSVFSQQERVLLSHNDKRNPRDAFFEDLQACVDRWHHNGEMVILGMDANQDIQSDPDQFARKCQLRSILTTRHPTTPLTATCNKNMNEIAVDGMWCSPGLDIEQCGMSGFGEVNIGKTDHRILWVDISMKSAFGYIPPAPTYKQPERLNTKNPKCVQRYTKLVKTRHKEERVLERLTSILSSIQQDGPSPELSKKFDKIPQIDRRIRRMARKNCRKLRMGKVPFSDEIQDFHRIINMWNLIILKRKGRRVDSRKIRDLMHQTASMEALKCNQDEAQVERKRTMQRYRKTKKRGDELRTAFGKKVAKSRAKKYKTTVAVQERIMKNVFRQKATFSRIGSVMKKPRANISYVTDGTGDDIEHHHSKEDIEKALMKEGSARFLQSYGTDFTVPPLVDDFSDLLSESIDEVLQGTYEPPDGTGEFVRKLLPHLKLPPDVPIEGNIGAVLDVDAHIAGWKKMKSKVNASPFGNTFADYIAGCEDVAIALVDSLLGFIPCFTGMIPDSWLHVIDVMIPKKKSSTHVSKMRMIVLFHALHNFQNKHFGRRMLAGMEERGQIPLEAYGSRKDHRAIECALNKVFTTDRIRQRHLTAALTATDAKSCYDRILHLIALICMRRAGLGKEPCYLMLGSLEELQHHIRTVYGDSETSYTGLALPFQGIFQGNGAGPTIWLVVSVPIIEMLKAQGFGLKATTAITKDHFELVCYTFVDDTDLIHTLPEGNSDTELLVTEMQSMLDHWEGGIRASGGALVPSKSYWFLMSFYWKDNRWHYRKMMSLPGKLTIRDSDGKACALERLDVHEARETLGTWIAMDGTQDAQYEALENKILSWGNKIRGQALSRTESFLSLRTSLSMSLQYPLAACTIKRSDLRGLTRLLMKIVLPTLGIPQSFPRALLHTPDLQMGYQFPCLDVEAGFHQLDVFLRNFNDVRLTGRLLHDTYETLQLELGVGQDPFLLPFKQWQGLATPCWVKQVWEFCSLHDIELKTPGVHVPLMREGDCYIMTVFVLMGYSGEELRLLNLCRLWHNVIIFSELVTGNGTHIRADARRHDKPIGTSSYEWPEAGFPSTRCWTLWNKALDHCFVDPADKTLKLKKPLGKWLSTPSEWPCWYSAMDDRIFKRQGNRFQMFSTRSRNTRRPRYLINSTIDSLPADATPTTCYGTNDNLRHEGTCEISPSPIEEERPEWWNATCLDSGEHMTHFFRGVRESTAVVICDGSFKDGWGTAAVASLKDINTTRPVLSFHLTPGPKEAHSPYRAELAGILASVLNVEVNRKKHQVMKGQVTIGCDCEAAMRTYLYCRTHTPAPRSPHYDLTSQLAMLLQTSTIKWEGKDIAGHQDDERPYEELDPWEQWNIHVDMLAKMHWQHYPTDHAQFYNLPGRKETTISKGGQRFTSWDKTELYRMIFQPASSAYIEDRFDFEQPHLIDFQSMGKAFKSTIMYKRLWLSKVLTNRLPTMENISKWTKEEEPNMCPRCGEEEDNDHIVWCEAAAEQRQIRVDKLADFLNAQCTAPSLKERIISLLTDDMESTPLECEQEDIQPELMVKGFIPEAWAESQDSYYKWINRRTTGKRWAERLIKQLWEIAWDMWSHRKKIEKSPESLLQAQRHANSNSLIQTEYEQQHDYPNDRLQRWFRRPLDEVLSHDLNFKQQWLEVVSSMRQAYLDHT